MPKRHGKSKGKPVTVATDTATFTKAQKLKLAVKPTGPGVSNGREGRLARLWSDLRPRARSGKWPA